MKKYGLDSNVQRKSGADILTSTELINSLPSKSLFQHGCLSSELGNSDDVDDLHDIQTGRFLQAIGTLSHSIRSYYEAEQSRVKTIEFMGRRIISKIVVRRNSEFIQGQDRYFGISADGKRVPMSEEEWEAYTGGTTNEEDVYEHGDTEFITLDRDYSAPMDRWDVLFDATEYINYVKNLQKQLDKLEDAQLELLDTTNPRKSKNDIIISRAEFFVQKEANIPPKALLDKVNYSIRGLIKQTRTNLRDAPKRVNELTYSSNWFPQKQDKRLFSKKAQDIIDVINTSDLSKLEVGRMIGNPLDRRPELVQQFRKQAEKTKPGRKKGQLLIRAQRVAESRMNDMVHRSITEDGKGILVTIQKQETQIPQSDMTRIWEAWHRRCIELYGENKLTSWKFKQHLNRKYMPQLSERLKEQLDKKEISKEEAALQKKLGWALIKMKVENVYRT